MNKTVIGCDIGNVIRNNIDSLPIVKSIEIINELSVDYEIIFISKCKPNYQLKCTEWLKENGLDKFKVYFCLEFYEKVNIATQNNVSIFTFSSSFSSPTPPNSCTNRNDWKTARMTIETSCSGFLKAVVRLR